MIPVQVGEEESVYVERVDPRAHEVDGRPLTAVEKERPSVDDDGLARVAALGIGHGGAGAEDGERHAHERASTSSASATVTTSP